MARQPPPRSMGDHLSSLELAILKGLHDGLTLEEVARQTKAPPVTLGKELARLQIGGYLGANGSPTKAGVEALKAQGQPAQAGGRTSG